MNTMRFPKINKRYNSLRDWFKPRKKSRLMHIKEAVDKSLEDLEQLGTKKPVITGIPTGLNKLDTMTSGFQKGDLIVVGGRPSMGKSAFAISIARNIAMDQKKSIAYFSLEMSTDKLIPRFLSLEANVDSHRLRSGLLSSQDWLNLRNAAYLLSKSNIYIDDTAGISLSELRKQAWSLKSKYNIRLLVVDELQLMHDFVMADNSPRAISNISMSLKILAEELDISIILLSQLSRDVETRDDFRPQLTDLAGQGVIAADADVALLLLRAEYYDPMEENRGVADVIVARNRLGPTGVVKISFIKECMRFENILTVEDLTRDV